jgi:hypothetical protein
MSSPYLRPRPQPKLPKTQRAAPVNRPRPAPATPVNPPRPAPATPVNPPRPAPATPVNPPRPAPATPVNPPRPASPSTRLELRLLEDCQLLNALIQQLAEHPTNSATSHEARGRARRLMNLIDQRTKDADWQVRKLKIAAAVAGTASIENELRIVRQRLDRLEIQSDAGEPSSATFQVCRTVARLAFATALGGLLGGPLIAAGLGEPVFSKVFEGAVGGLLGAATSEISDPLTERAEDWERRR